MREKRTPQEWQAWIRARVRENEHGCWLWRGALTRGYARTRRYGKNIAAHRLSYEVFVGPIPEGLTIDHLCRVPHCVNPEHLEPVTMRQNTMRGFGPTAEHARATHCPRGHAYAGENLYVDKNGGRACRACWKSRRQRGGCLSPELRKALRLLEEVGVAQVVTSNTHPDVLAGRPCVHYRTAQGLESRGLARITGNEISLTGLAVVSGDTQREGRK